MSARILPLAASYPQAAAVRCEFFRRYCKASPRDPSPVALFCDFVSLPPNHLKIAGFGGLISIFPGYDAHVPPRPLRIPAVSHSRCAGEISPEEYTFPGERISSLRMLYSIGVSVTGSPSTVTVLIRHPAAAPGGKHSCLLLQEPRFVYLRS